MIAKFRKIENKEYFDGFKPSHRKENSFYKEISVMLFDTENNKFITPFLIRFYSTANTDYCVIWHNSLSCEGGFTLSAKASGYGYHRASSAFAQAISQLFKFNENDGSISNIDGAGFTAVEEAMKAIIKLYPQYEKFPMHFHTANA